MSTTFNSIPIEVITYNGEEVLKVLFNGEVVYEAKENEAYLNHFEVSGTINALELLETEV